MHKQMHPAPTDRTEIQMTEHQQSSLRLAREPERRVPALHGHTGLELRSGVLSFFPVWGYRYDGVVARGTGGQ